MQLLINLDGEGPLYMQLYRAVKNLILAGSLAEGQKLPSTRQLAKQLSVSRNVVLLGYEQLKAEGYIVGGFGGGTRVVEHLPDDGGNRLALGSPDVNCIPDPVQLTSQAAIALAYWRARPQLNPNSDKPLNYDFRYGDIDVDSQSVKIWKQLSSRLFNQHVHQYGEPQGELHLRTKLADYLNNTRGCHCTAEQIAIVNGSQQALDIIARLFITEKSSVILEEPGYQAAKAVFQAAGAHIIPVSVDQDGLQTDRLPPYRGETSLVYVTPSHQFPTGSILSLFRRLALLEWAEQTHSFIIEDDYDSEFRFEGRPISALQGLDNSGRTLYR